MKKIIEVEGLCKNFQQLEVLKDLSFGVAEGEVVSVIGPSGSGKSTLLRIINQLEKANAGRIKVGDLWLCQNDKNNQAVYSSTEVLKKIQLKIGLVFQNFHLFPHLSIMDNLTKAPIMVLKKTPTEAKAKALELLEKLNLGDKAYVYPYQLSGGQQQRVAIARALAMNPEIIFFDEPTSALDPELTGEVLKVIRSLAVEKYTMVVVTHEMAFARDLSDKIIFMDEGQIVDYGTPDQVFQSENQRTKLFLQRYQDHTTSSK